MVIAKVSYLVEHIKAYEQSGQKQAAYCPTVCGFFYPNIYSTRTSSVAKLF